jgi:hypothetical protein
MGIDFENLKKQAEGLLEQHGDKIEEGVEKAGDFAKERFGHDETVDKVVDKVQDLIPGEHGQSDQA